MINYLKRVGLVLCTAYILAFFSEYVFVNEAPAFEVVAGWRESPAGVLGMLVELSVWYGVPAYFFVWAIAQFEVQHVWGLVLAGALYGFLTEGAVAAQMYEGLPFTISWTPLGWHVLVDVLVGWYLVRRVLVRGVYWQTAVMAAGLGAAWGVWGTWYGVEEVLLPPADFTVLALVTGGVWVVVNGLFERLLDVDFRPSRWGVWSMTGVGVLIFILQIMLVLPWALLVLPLLLGVSVWALWRGKPNNGEATVLGQLRGRVGWPQTLLLGLMPLTAVVVYPLAYSSGAGPVLVDLLIPLLMLAGFVVFGASWWRVVRQKGERQETATQP